MKQDHQAKAGCPVGPEDVGRLSANQIEQVKKFIEQTGGVENARRAIEALERRRPAA